MTARSAYEPPAVVRRAARAQRKRQHRRKLTRAKMESRHAGRRGDSRRHPAHPRSVQCAARHTGDRHDD